MIPIFRAKRLYSDEYVFGVPRQDSEGMCEMIINVVEDGIAGVIQRYIEVDTLAIHFPDNMIDSQGNKIFASLQEDGKGGDILLEESRLMCNLKIDESAFREFTAIHTINGNMLTNEKILSDIGSYRDKYFKGYDIMIYDFFMMKKRNIKIIGIQQ